MRRFMNWLRGIFGRRRRTSFRIDPVLRWVTTDDGTIIDGVVSITCYFEGDTRRIHIEAVQPHPIDHITIPTRIKPRVVRPAEGE